MRKHRRICSKSNYAAKTNTAHTAAISTAATTANSTNTAAVSAKRPAGTAVAKTGAATAR